jgi:hypothetical protein
MAANTRLRVPQTSGSVNNLSMVPQTSGSVNNLSMVPQLSGSVNNLSMLPLTSASVQELVQQISANDDFQFKVPESPAATGDNRDGQRHVNVNKN